MKRLRPIIIVFVAVLLLTQACIANPGFEGEEGVRSSEDPGVIYIEAASSVSLLEEAGIFQMFEEETGIKVDITYYGDVDLKMKVELYSSNGVRGVDAIWVGSPIWAPGRLLQEEVSIMRTFVVAGINPNVADNLGWSDNITMEEFLNEGIRNGALKLAVPNSSQDDAGANFLFATISALNPGRAYVDKSVLDNTALQEELRTVFSSVTGSDSDAGRLKDRFVIDQKLDNPRFNGFILPESLAIAANLELEAEGAEAMRIFYISDATGVQSYQIGWVDGINEGKQESVRTLVRYLLDQGEFANDSVDVQSLIQEKAYFRTGAVGMTIDNPDPEIFNSEWGIITDQDFVPANLPKDDTIQYALSMYQVLFKKPAATAYCLDFSGSMAGSGENQRNQAMTLLLDQEQAAKYLLQAGPDDITHVFKFHHNVSSPWTVRGNDPAHMSDQLLWTVSTLESGNTNIYGCVFAALVELLNDPAVQEGTVLPSVILLTDGMNNEEPKLYNGKRGLNGVAAFYADYNLGIPIYSIMLGDADQRDLNPLVEFSNGALCDGRGSQEALIACFREFKGSN